MKNKIFLLLALIAWGQMALAQVQSANWNSNAQSWKVSPASWPCSGQAPPSFSGWQWNSSAGDGTGGMQVMYVRCTSPAQDSSFYMASPMVNLVAGNTYRVSIKSRAGTASTRKLRIGRNNTRFKAGSTQLLETANVGTSFATYTTDFTVPSTGNYSIIISGVFVANETAMLYADDYSLTLVNTPPSAISITAPSSNGLFHTFTANTINTSWTDTENNVTKVEFFAGNTKLGEKTSSPWRFDWNPSIGGNYTLTAKATDAFGASLTSAGVAIRVNARPSLSLSYPPQTIGAYFNCSNYVTQEDIMEGQYPEGPFLATANATDADGQVVKVDFYKNNVLLFTDTQAPWQYSYQMSAYDEGELLAIATDNDGATNADNYVQPLLYFGPISCYLYNSSNTLKQTLCLGDSLLLGSQPESLETMFFATSIQWQRNTGSGWTNVAGTGNSNACGNAPYQHEIYAKSGLYRAIWTLTIAATCTTQVDTVITSQPVVSVDSAISFFWQSIGVKAKTIGGILPYTYSWTNSDTCISLNCDSVKISNFDNDNTVTVTDNIGCSNSTKVKIKIIIQDDSKSFQPYLKKIIPNYNSKVENIEDKFQDFISESKLNENQNRRIFPNNIITIPVVFGVINNNTSIGTGLPGENLDNKIKNTFLKGSSGGLTNREHQINVLNSAFKNSPIPYNGTNYTIQFCLATKDDAGNPVPNGTFIIDDPAKSYFVELAYVQYKTDPNNPNSPWAFFPWSVINQSSCDQSFQVPSLLPNTESDITKGYSNSVFNMCGWYDLMNKLSNFSRKKYLKIIVCDRLFQPASATTPSYNIAPISDESIKQKYDGVILDIDYFMDFGTAGSLKQGKVLLHEIGHWLNLNHTFENFCNAHEAETNNINYVDGYPQWDLVKDTPPQKTNGDNFTDGTICPNTLVPSSVYTTFPFSPNNYMDYTNDIKRNFFSPGQIERMFYSLAYFRNELYTIDNLQNTGVSCVEPIAAFDLSTNYVCGTGTNASITVNRLNNPIGTMYSWTSNPSSGVTFLGSNSDPSRTISFNTSSIGNEVTISLSCTLGTKTVSYSQKVYVSEFCAPCILPQKQNLFFGNYAGLSFTGNSNLPQPNLGAFSSTPQSERIKSEGGVVSMSDDDGNLLFYASGNKIWNKNHKLLSPVLFTDEQSSQYGVAIKSPEFSLSNQVYLLFTVPSKAGANYNKGLRMHKIRVSSTNGINHSTNPQANLNDYNIPILPPLNAPSGDDGAAKVSEKITVVPKLNHKDFYIIVQGPSDDAVFGKKFYVYEVVGNSNPVPIQTFDAKYLSDKGVLKISPNAAMLLSTYTRSFNPLTGFSADGDNACVFNFNTLNGDISYKNELVISSGSASSYGGSFSPNSNIVYLNINKPNTAGANPLSFSGIYKFDINSQGSGQITGILVSKILAGTSNSVDIILASNNTILISNPAKQGFYEECCPSSSNPSFGNFNLGIIHFPDNYTQPGFTWEGPKLITNATQNIRSRTGLPNFSDAIKPAGNDKANPQNLGINPMTCCGYTTYTQNVACTGNENGIGGNDFYYTFTVAPICGPDYPNVEIKTCGSDFGVNAKVWLKRNGNIWGDALNANDHFTLSNCQSGNGQIFVLNPLTEENFSSISFERPFEFLVEVEAQNQTATGNFKTEIKILEDYAYFNGTQWLNCGNIPVSCCRKAVSDEEEKKPTLNNHSFANPSMKLIPNPAKGRVHILLEGFNEDGIIILNDALGREVLRTTLSQNNELNISHLAKGLYQVRARDNISFVFKTLVIE